MPPLSGVAAFISKIGSMRSRWRAVSSQSIIEREALALRDEITKLIDDPNFAGSTSPEMLALSNALADYLDSRPEGREPPWLGATPIYAIRLGH